MSAYTDKVRPRTLRSDLSALEKVAVGALKKAHIYASRRLRRLKSVAKLQRLGTEIIVLKKIYKNIKIEQ